MIKIKRVYEQPSRGDGLRILVDRLWPRGLTKEKASVDEWMKDIAPSDELRRFFGHDPERWHEFRKRYREELESKQDLLQRLKEVSMKGGLTLVFSARDTSRNNAVVLKELLDD